MKTMIIRRVATGEQGTFGAITFNDIPFTLTLEREWLDNKPSVGDVAGSCIPAGTYIGERVDSPRFKKTFEVKSVPDRSHILFHKGNLDDDSRGCILIGEKFGKVSGSDGIQASKEGFNKFLGLLENENEFRLIIVDDWKNSIN